MILEYDFCICIAIDSPPTFDPDNIFENSMFKDVTGNFTQGFQGKTLLPDGTWIVFELEYLYFEEKNFVEHWISVAIDIQSLQGKHKILHPLYQKSNSPWIDLVTKYFLNFSMYFFENVAEFDLAIFGEEPMAFYGLDRLPTSGLIWRSGALDKSSLEALEVDALNADHSFMWAPIKWTWPESLSKKPS